MSLSIGRRLRLCLTLCVCLSLCMVFMMCVGVIESVPSASSEILLTIINVDGAKIRKCSIPFANAASSTSTEHIHRDHGSQTVHPRVSRLTLVTSPKVSEVPLCVSLTVSPPIPPSVGERLAATVDFILRGL